MYFNVRKVSRMGPTPFIIFRGIHNLIIKLKDFEKQNDSINKNRGISIMFDFVSITKILNHHWIVWLSFFNIFLFHGSGRYSF